MLTISSLNSRDKYCPFVWHYIAFNTQFSIWSQILATVHVRHIPPKFLRCMKSALSPLTIPHSFGSSSYGLPFLFQTICFINGHLTDFLPDHKFREIKFVKIQKLYQGKSGRLEVFFSLRSTFSWTSETTSLHLILTFISSCEDYWTYSGVRKISESSPKGAAWVPSRALQYPFHTQTRRKFYFWTSIKTKPV